MPPPTIEPITLRTYRNDAGIRSTWLIGDWPKWAGFSNELLVLAQSSDVFIGIGDLSASGGVISIGLLNASATYRITETDEFRDMVFATLETGTISIRDSYA